MPAVAELATQPADEGGVCLDCGASFQSMSALHGHRAKVHGHRNFLRRKLEGTSCLYCLCEWWTRERLFYHVKKAKFCRQFYDMHVAVWGPDDVIAFDLAASGTQKHNRTQGLPERHVAKPPVRMQGPRPFCRREIAASCCCCCWPSLLLAAPLCR